MPGMSEKAEHGWTLLEMARNGLTRPVFDGNGCKWLQIDRIAGTVVNWLEMTGMAGSD